MKNTILIFALIMAVASLAFAIYHNDTADHAVEDLQEERYARMVAEKDLLKAKEELAKSITELESVQLQLKNSEKLLKQSQTVNKDLRAKLDKIEASKVSLEKKIQDMNKMLGTNKAAVATGDI